MSEETNLLINQPLEEIPKKEEEPVKKGSTVLQTRLHSLDVFRGITMFFMIMVDDMGDFDYVYWTFNHSEWNGCTPADVVFPAFIFIVGVAIPFALTRTLQKSHRWFELRKNIRNKIFLKISRRAVLLWVIGLFLNITANLYKFKKWRIMGILQRIGTVYFFLAFSFVLFNGFWLVQLIVVSVFALIYVVVMYSYKVPGCDKGSAFTDYCNPSGYFDRQVLTRHHMIYPTDPEGLFSTFSASINLFFGLSCGLIILLYFRDKKNTLRYNSLILKRLIFGSKFFIAYPRLYKIFLLSIPGFIGLFLGLILKIWIPWNKSIWSLSFAFFTSGISGLLLVFLHIVVDLNRYGRPILKIFEWMGTNPLVVFVLMVLLEILLLRANVGNVQLWHYIYIHGYNSWISNKKFASFVFAFCHFILWDLVSFILYRKRIFIKL
ncbi:hypothetical protein M0811_10830 [Anaeramoeba ignava]|uniref:DUF5009 domain-containing protein n=1 Tax=Anaeramoeba ignava TaxID=1746090 RepID=A0A9Q0LD82_ANAIG|nr:hypothetical protein M0811_10830 [Anaeramoeba ignava]